MPSVVEIGSSFKADFAQCNKILKEYFYRIIKHTDMTTTCIMQYPTTGMTYWALRNLELLYRMYFKATAYRQVWKCLRHQFFQCVIRNDVSSTFTNQQ